MSHPIRGVRISSSALDFQIVRSNLAKSLPTFYHYRKPQVKHSNGSFYIEYYYRIPVNIRPLYNNKEWHRFRIREDINKRGSHKKEYAEWLRSEIENSLKNGYNPFNQEAEFISNESIKEVSELNATEALELFLEEWKARGLEPVSLSKYTKVITRLIEWLQLKSIPYIDIKEITQNHIEQFLRETKSRFNFSNREYNNHFDFTRTAFNFLVKKKYIEASPCAGISKLKSKSVKHRYYDEKSLSAITKAMTTLDPYVLLAFQTIYYLCIRSDKELMNLKISNINLQEGKVLIEVSKSKHEDYIPLDTHMKDLFIKHGIESYPEDYYVFGIEGRPSQKSFGKGFFSKRFRKVRDKAGLSEDFTLYSAKHTRIIHLKQDGLDDANIMKLTRHKDFSAYAKYLRDLGLDADASKINKLSRKI